MEFSEEYLKKIIDKIFDLYLIQHKRYLMQFKGGEYKQNRPESPLKRYHLHKHLKGERTIGTFARTYVTKFLCFDVDFSDLEIAKWVTYKIGNSLDQLGLHHYYVSFSGKKGYHVELFLDEFISTERAHQFYLFILRAAGIPSHYSGKVEYRPFATQGVKLPLGTHQGTGNFCGFCSLSNGLRIMDRNESFSYFLEIKKIDTERILSIVVDEDSSELRDMENAISSHNWLINYEQSGNYSVEGALELYHNGLSQSSQRHSSFMLLARLMNHNQVCKEEAIEVIMEWLDKQDQRFYRSKRDACLKDAENVVDFVYSNNLTLAVAERDLTVSFREINAIMRYCLEKNQKKLMYALLIHSKRWAAEENGTFYMTFQQMEESAGINARTAMRLIHDLEKLKVIEVVKRDQRKKGMSKKMPNVYRVTLIENERENDERKFEVNGRADLCDCLKFFYDDKNLRSLLPRRQYSTLISATG